MNSVTVTRRRLPLSHRIKWTLMAIFLPYRYWRLRYQEELTDAIHPESGWIWRDEEQGGKAIAAARDEGYRLGSTEMLDRVVGSLRDYPNAGGDINVMREVGRLIAEARIHPQRHEITSITPQRKQRKNPCAYSKCLLEHGHLGPCKEIR